MGEQFWTKKLRYVTKLVQAQHVHDVTEIVRHNGANFKGKVITQVRLSNTANAVAIQIRLT